MKSLLLIALLMPVLAMAEITPNEGPFDPHVRVVDYNPADVVRLTTYYGVSTHVQFGDDETISAVAVGDDQAWKVIPRQNHLFIKPVQVKADTNVTVVTNKHTYQFVLVVQPRPAKDAKAWDDPNLIYSLSFRYPDEEAKKRAAKAQADALKTHLSDMKAKLADASKSCKNNDYWAQGSSEITPTGACDDGRFIYLTFTNNRDLPAVYTIDPADGSESLVDNAVINGNTIEVQRMSEKLMLRRGASVVSVVNRAFDMDGGKDNTSGTIAPDVQRVIKGAE